MKLLSTVFFLFFSLAAHAQKRGFFNTFGSDIVGRIGGFAITEKERDPLGFQTDRESHVFLNANLAVNVNRILYVGFARRQVWEKIGPESWEYFPMDGGFAQFQLLPDQPKLNVWLELGFFTGRFRSLDRFEKTAERVPYSAIGLGVERRLKGPFFWHLQWSFRDEIDRKKGPSRNSFGPPAIGFSYHIFTRRTPKTAKI